MTIAIVVGLLVVGIGLVLSQLFRLKDWLNRQPRPARRTSRRTRNLIELPAAVRAMAGRGPDWADWVRRLPAIAVDMLARWRLRPDGPPMHGHRSLVLPVRTADGAAAVLKISFPTTSPSMSIGAAPLGRCRGGRLLSADPHRRAMLLERLHGTDLTGPPTSTRAGWWPGCTGGSTCRPCPRCARSVPTSGAGTPTWPRCRAVRRSRAAWSNRRRRWRRPGRRAGHGQSGHPLRPALRQRAGRRP